MTFDASVITDHWRFLAYGIGVTIALAAASGAASLALGFGVALARLFGPRWAKPAIVLYIDSMRAVPVLVVLVWTFFALPILTGLTMQPFVAALIGLTVHLAAYAAEIYHAGSIRTSACGSTMRRRICGRDMPSAGADAARVRLAPLRDHQRYGHRFR